jgi:hypothetical protein
MEKLCRNCLPNYVGISTYGILLYIMMDNIHRSQHTTVAPDSDLLDPDFSVFVKFTTE